MPSTIWSGTQAFTATAGEATVVPIRMPHRGTLHGCNLVQTSGATSGVTAKLLSSKRDKEPNSNLPEDAFLVATLQIASGQSQVVNQNVDVAYHNQDGDPSNPQRFLYLKITPAGTGEKSFALSVTVGTPVL